MTGWVGAALLALCGLRAAEARPGALALAALWATSQGAGPPAKGDPPRGLLPVPRGGQEEVRRFVSEQMEPRHAVAVAVVGEGTKRHRLLEDVAEDELLWHLVGIGAQLAKGSRSTLTLHTWRQDPEAYTGKWTRSAIHMWLLNASYPLVNRMQYQFAPRKYLTHSPFGAVLVVKPLQQQSEELIKALEPYAQQYSERLKFTFFTRAAGTQQLCDRYGVWTNDELLLLENPTTHSTSSHSHVPLPPKYRLEGVTPESVRRFFDAYADGTWPRYFKSASRRGPPRAEGGGLRELTGWDFAEAVADPEFSVLVEFVSKGCGSCEEFAPTVAEVAQRVAEARTKGTNSNLAGVLVARIDQSANEHSELVKGTPWLRYWPRGREKRPVDVEMRDAEYLLEFLEERVAEERETERDALAQTRAGHTAKGGSSHAVDATDQSVCSAREGAAGCALDDTGRHTGGAALPPPSTEVGSAGAAHDPGTGQTRLGKPNPRAARGYLSTELDPGD